jgi:hypothetical protein
MYSSLDPSFAMHWHHACQLSETLRAVTVASARTGRLPDAEFHLVPTLVACLKGAVRVELPRGHVDLAVDEALLLPLGIKHRHAPLRAGSVAFGLGFMLDRADIGLHIGEDIWVATIPEQPARGHLEAACSADAAERLRLTCQALGQMQVDVIKPQAPMPEPTYRMWMYLRRERMSPISSPRANRSPLRRMPAASAAVATSRQPARRCMASRPHDWPGSAAPTEAAVRAP